MLQGVVNHVIEWSYTSGKRYTDPFYQVNLTMEVMEPDGKTKTIQAFWRGDMTWTFRYSPLKPGLHQFITYCNDNENTDLHNKTGSVDVVEYNGANPLYKHGALKVADNGRTLAHTDGTPFLWLGDTWWMALTNRMKFPGDFNRLMEDRIKKGFNVVQLVAGLYPDMPPFDERSASDAGFPWDSDFGRVNPAFFDLMDQRIGKLVEAGLVPCIVGSWGYYLDFAGINAIKRHWDNLVARYGAYPVVWCAAGEALMPFYGSIYWSEEKNQKYRQIHSDLNKMQEYRTWAKEGWTEIAWYIRRIDPYKRLVTIHPTDCGHNMVSDPSVIDIDMLQTGHGGWESFKQTVDMVEESVGKRPVKPVIDDEISYEGIGGMCGPEVQRFSFWACMLSGTAGHTYGANGIWQMNTGEWPYGPSPHGMTWGNTPWDEAMNFYGSTHIGHAKKLLERYRWWQFEPHPDWIEPHSTPENRVTAYAAGIPSEVRIFYLPLSFIFGKKPVLKNLEQGVTYKAFFFDCTTAKQYDYGVIQGDMDGMWKLRDGFFPVYMDLILVLEAMENRNLQV